MRVLTTLFLVPAALVLAMVLIFTSNPGIVIGVFAAVIYLAVVVARASDWT